MQTNVNTVRISNLSPLRGMTATGRTAVHGLRVRTQIKAGPNGCGDCGPTSQ
jgi:hypothetical protein